MHEENILSHPFNIKHLTLYTLDTYMYVDLHMHNT